MHDVTIGFIVLLIVVAGFSLPASADGANIAVNVTNAYSMRDQDQDALIKNLRDNNVSSIRMAISGKAPTQRTTRFISKAFSAGIGTILIVNVTEGGTRQRTRPVDRELHFYWPAEPLSDSDPEGFRKWTPLVLGALDKDGVRLTALELGNEINNAQFNGDFVRSLASGRVLGLNDFNNHNDASAQAIANGYRAYLRIAEVLKDWRDHSNANKKTPIISAGLVPSQAGKIPNSKVDSAGGTDTLEFLKQNGLDRLVDGYGIHIYPSLNPTETFPTGSMKC